MNMVDAELARGDEGLSVSFGDHRLGLGNDPGLDRYVGKSIVLGIRPEDFEDAELSPSARAESRITATCTLTEALGSEVLVYFPVDARREGETVVAPRLVARVSPRTNIREGARMELVADTRRLHFFDQDTGAAVGSSPA